VNPQRFSQLQPSLVQLRLAVPYRAIQHIRYLVMFVTLNIMQHEDQSIAGRQVVDCPLQGHPINRTS
jgi:hypothetical protein